MAKLRDRYDSGTFLFESYRDFSGGMNTAFSKELLAINDLEVAQNIDLSQRGAIWTQKGFVRKYATTIGAYVGQSYIYYKHDGIIEEIFALNGKLWKYNEGTEVWDELVITGLETGFQTTKPISWTVYRDVLYIATGTKLVQYDGTTLQVVSAYTPTTEEQTAIGTNIYADTNLSIHKARFCMVHFDRLVLGWDDDNPLTLYFSDYERFGYFPFPNQYVFDNPRGEPITSIVKYRDNLIVFTESTIQGFFGDTLSTSIRRTLHTGLGSVAPLSAKVVGNAIAFVSYDGVKQIFSLSQVEQYFNVKPLDRFDKIKPNIIGKTANSLKSAVAVVHNDQYIVNFPLDNEAFRYYMDLDGWSVDVSTNMARSAYLTIDGKLYGLGYNNGLIYQHDTGWNYDGLAIHSIAKPKLFDLTEPMYRKRLSKLHILLGQLENMPQLGIYVTVEADGVTSLTPYEGEAYVDPVDNTIKWQLTKVPNFYTNNNAVVDSWLLGEATLGISPLIQRKASIRGQARRVQLTFESDTLDVPMSLYGFGLEFQMRRL